MSINPVSITVPHPSTTRGQATHLSYDSVNDRIAYVNGKSIIVRPVDFNSTSPVICFSKHTFTTMTVKFSPSGYYIASGDESGNIKIWDTSIDPNNKTITKFEPPTIKSEFQVMSGPIRSIAWDADNARIIAVGQGKEKFGHCFSWDSGNSIGDIQGHSGPINAVDIKSQRPYRAATVSDDHALVFFNGPPFKFDKSLRGHHSNVVRDVKFSPNGEYLISVGSDRSICVYQGKTGEFVSKIENAHEGGIFAVAWLSDSKYFITASADNTLKKWDISNSECVQTFTVGETRTVQNQQVGLVLAKEYIISLSASGDLNYFNYDSGELVQVVKGHQHSLTKISTDESATNLFSGSADGVLLKWKLDDEKNLQPLPTLQGNQDEAHANYVVDVLVVGNTTYSVGWDDVLKSWTEEGKVTESVKLPSQPRQLAHISSGLLVLYESQVELYSESLELITSLSLDFSSTCISPINDSTCLLTNTTGSTIEEIKIESGSITKTNKQFTKMRSPPTLITVSPNKELFAVADSAGKYTLFKAEDASVITTRWAFHSSKVYDAQWTPDSKYLLSGGLDSGLFIYSVDRPSKVVKFPLAHPSGISNLKWLKYDNETKQGKFVSSGLDGTIRTWEVKL
ncbi:AIP1 [[Candida] subhashii]|uniref:AIP1 n=1 Tax=[Candida] subhashii TaxID=561895 RepID=A0A8J5UX54_9ASCO|nr:AIP1 [[Candida] subhashii]KAG7663485.1 AIP1 [[Candida] subhashii]